MEFNIYRTNEQELISGCLRGDHVAQRKLYDTYAPKMYAICYRYLKDPMLAEDALVAAFTRILNKISQYTGEGSFEGWMKTIVIRESLALLRQQYNLRREADLESYEMHPQMQHSHDPLGTEDLLNMIGELPPGYRTVFNLYAIDGFSHKEIAEQLQISENTSKSQLSRARTFLQQLMVKYHYLQIPTQNDVTSG